MGDSEPTTPSIEDRVTKIETEHIKINKRLDTLDASYNLLLSNSMSNGGRRQKQRQQKQQKQRQQQQQSGGDASNHAIDVFGGLGQQQAQAGSNVIASRQAGQAGGSGLAALAPSELGAGSPVQPSAPAGGDVSVQKGGKRRTRKHRQQQKQQRKTKHSRQ